MNPYDKFRSTGRSTHMLRGALNAALRGENKKVLVIGWGETDTVELMKLMWKLPELKQIAHQVDYTRREITVGGTGRVLFRAGSHGRYDYHAHRYEGYSPSTPLFVDHYTLEQIAKEQYSERSSDRSLKKSE